VAVYHAQKANRNLSKIFMIFTVLMAVGFLVVKGFEWYQEIGLEHHLPGPGFRYENDPNATVFIDPAKAQLFFCLYFAMTGLHAIHVIIGILLIGTLALMVQFRHRAVQYYMPIEMTGLYWHFVDIVWIFLFPLFYLIPKGG